MKPGDAPAPPHLREGIALLAAYLLSSGRGLFEEPPNYAIYRLLDGARRALELLETCGEPNPHLVSVRACLDGVFYGPLTERDYAVLTDDLCQQMANGLKYFDTSA
ncbi:MAG: DUF6092 family protein [Pseudonocardiaceae bacterium]